MSDAFGRRVRAYRKLKQMTQADLAAEVGASVAVIGGLERGTRTPTADMVRILMRVLNVEEHELWGETSPPPRMDR